MSSDKIILTQISAIIFQLCLMVFKHFNEQYYPLRLLIMPCLNVHQMFITSFDVVQFLFISVPVDFIAETNITV